MGEFRVTINPKNKPATPEVNWQQARVLEMQAEYAAAFDTQAGTYEEMRARREKDVEQRRARNGRDNRL